MKPVNKDVKVMLALVLRTHMAELTHAGMTNDSAAQVSARFLQWPRKKSGVELRSGCKIHQEHRR